MTRPAAVDNPPCEDGFSMLELVVVVAVVGILLAVGASRILPYIAQAERVAVVRMENQLRNVLVLEAALIIARGESARLAELDLANPMSLVLEPPRNYLGELNAPTLDLLPTRSWYFDSATRHLIYRAGRGYEGSKSVPVLHEYSVRIEYADTDSNAQFSPGTDAFHGVRLRRLNRSNPGA